MKNAKDIFLFIITWGGVILGLLVIAMVGAYISIKISVIGTEVAVPDITGTAVERAYGILSDKGLFLEVEGEKNDERFAQGNIISQDPPAASKIRKGRKIKVIVSLGTREIQTPNLVGETERSARIRVTEEGLIIGSVSSAQSDVEEGKVIAQSPPQGSNKLKGGGVNLLVSSGKQKMLYVMPDLIDRNYDDVEPLLRFTGLRTSVVVKERAPGARQGSIIAQNPLSGYPVGEKQTISLTIAD